jgi:primosomal protein N'
VISKIELGDLVYFKLHSGTMLAGIVVAREESSSFQNNFFYVKWLDNKNREDSLYSEETLLLWKSQMLS